MVNVDFDLIVVLKLLSSTSEPNTKAIIGAAIEELERLRGIEERAIKVSRAVIEGGVIKTDLCREIIAFGGGLSKL